MSYFKLQLQPTPPLYLMFANLIMPWILLPRCKISIPGQHNIKFTLLI